MKQLINDIAYDNINLSQALTRSKLFAIKIENNIFKQWLIKELEGYDYDDPLIPSYRKIWSPITLQAQNISGIQNIEVDLPKDEFDDNEFDFIRRHQILEPISIIEEQINSFQKTKGYLNLSLGQAKAIGNLYYQELNRYRATIISGSRVVGKAQYQNVLHLTKQKLLDTLIELNKEFPNLNDDYTMSKENNEKAQHIITNNIYGSNMNVSTGDNVQQTFNQNINFSPEDESKLLSLGVEQNSIDELKEILEKTPEKSSRKDKVMKWFGGVAASVAGRGLYDSIPAITEFVNNLTN